MRVEAEVVAAARAAVVARAAVRVAVVAARVEAVAVRVVEAEVAKAAAEAAVKVEADSAAAVETEAVAAGWAGSVCAAAAGGSAWAAAAGAAVAPEAVAAVWGRRSMMRTTHHLHPASTRALLGRGRRNERSGYSSSRPDRDRGPSLVAYRFTDAMSADYLRQCPDRRHGPGPRRGRLRHPLRERPSAIGLREPARQHPITPASSTDIPRRFAPIRTPLTGMPTFRSSPLLRSAPRRRAVPALPTKAENSQPERPHQDRPDRRTGFSTRLMKLPT